MESELAQLKAQLEELNKKVDVEVARNKVHDLVVQNTVKIFSKQFIVLAASQIIVYTSPQSRRNKPKIDLNVRYKTLYEFETNVVKPAKSLLLLNPDLRRVCPSDAKTVDEYNIRS